MTEVNRPAPVPAKSKRILVLDDDEHILEMMARTLEFEGFTVRTARDGRSVSKVAIAFEPHLIITDLMMPGGGGYEVLRTLQSDDSTRQISVFVMSGHGFDQSTKDLMKQEPNVVDYIDKPVNLAALISKIHKHLNTISKNAVPQEPLPQTKDIRIEHDKLNDVF